MEFGGGFHPNRHSRRHATKTPGTKRSQSEKQSQLVSQSLQSNSRKRAQLIHGPQNVANLPVSTTVQPVREMPGPYLLLYPHPCTFLPHAYETNAVTPKKPRKTCQNKGLTPRPPRGIPGCTKLLWQFPRRIRTAITTRPPTPAALTRAQNLCAALVCARSSP